MADRLEQLLAELQETYPEVHRKLISKSTRMCSHDPSTTGTNLLLRRIRNLHVNINQERLKGKTTMANPPGIGTRHQGNTPKRKPRPVVAARKTRIQDHSVELDERAALDIRTALSEYHGRLTRAVGDSVDMNESSKLAADLITVRLIHDTIEKDHS